MPQERFTVPLIGGHDEQEALKLNASQSINWMMTPTGNGRIALTACPGITDVGAAGSHADDIHGFAIFQDDLLLYTNEDLYQVYADGSVSITKRDDIATLPAGRDARFVVGGDYGVVVQGSGVMVAADYTSTWNHTIVSDGDASTDVVDLTYIDGYFFTVDSANKVQASDLNDPTSWNSLNFVNAVAKSDQAQRLGRLDGDLYVLKEESIQVYYNAGNPTGFPFSERLNARHDIGISAANSLKNFADGLVFLDTSGFVRWVRSYETRILSSIAMHEAVNSYATIDDAYAMTYDIGGHSFYHITFPTANVTWVYDTLTDEWHQREEIGGTEHKARDSIMYRGLPVVAFYDGDGNNVGTFDLDANADSEDAIKRTRVSQHIRQDGKKIFIDSIELYLDVSNIACGESPVISMEYSKDGGHSWSTAVNRSIDTTPDNKERIVWNRLGAARNWTFRFITDEQYVCHIIDGTAKGRIGLT